MFDKLKTTNIWLLIVSLILAIALWVYIVGEEAIEVSREVPLTITTPSEMTVAQTTAKTVTVLLQVPRNMVSLLDRQPITVTHKIEDVEEAGKYSFNLKPQDVDRPSVIMKVKQIIPERVVCTLDKVINKRLPVVANLVNDPAAGYKVNKDGIQIDPNAVLVAGAQSVLEKTQFILTEPIDIIGRIRSFRKKVSLKQDAGYTVVNNVLIDVFIPILEEFSEKEFTDFPIMIMSAANSTLGARLDPGKVTFVLQGPKEVISRITNDDITAYINIVDLGVGKYKLPLQFNMPQGVSLRDTVPVVEVTVVERKEQLPMPAAVVAPASQPAKDTKAA